MASGSTAKRLFWPLLQRPVMSRASCFHATGDAEYNDIRRLGFGQPVAIIPNGIHLPKVESTGTRPPDALRTLLFVGRIHPTKGIDLLLEAWREVAPRFPDWQLQIVGSDRGYRRHSGYLAKMQELARSLDAKRVVFSGELNGARKWEAFQQADLYVLPSHSENFGMTVAEALASGTPVITTRGTPWEQLGKRGAGWWVDISVGAIASALRDACSRTATDLAEMGLRGRRWMEEEYSWDVIGRKMSLTYRWLAGGTPDRPEWIRTA